MCVLAFAWAAHARWRLVVAGNRDERHDRPAAPIARWGEGGVIAGRDLQSGGTWLGVSEAGRLAVVTNLRGYEPPAPDRPSRGALVHDLLAGAGAYADPATAAIERFNPFNLIVADATRALYLTNRPEALRSPLGHGVYGLSNGALDAPWPKTMRLKAIMSDWLSGPAADPADLLDGLGEEHLPAIGVPLAPPSDVAEEPRLSSIFIRDPVYGTRCSTVVAIDAAGAGVIIERRFSAAGEDVGETRIGFRWVV